MRENADQKIPKHEHFLRSEREAVDDITDLVMQLTNNIKMTNYFQTKA